MSMRIYSQDAGTTIRMKVEDPANGAISVETDAVTTTSNAWETLNFDFANQAAGTAPLNFANNYQKLSVFFNFGIDGATAGTKTYYFDDVQFGGSVAVTDPTAEEFRLVVSEAGLYIRSSNSRAISGLEIHDLLGRPFFRATGTYNTNMLIPVAFDRSSLYVVKVTTDRGTSVFKGVVVK
jgi:hypothetical protein